MARDRETTNKRTTLGIDRKSKVQQKELADNAFSVQVVKKGREYYSETQGHKWTPQPTPVSYLDEYLKP